MATESGVITREIGGQTVIEIEAQNVDFRNCESIKSAIAGIVSGGKSQVVLNLSKVSFMDSSGLGILLYGKRLCDDAGGSFALCGLQSYVNNLMMLTNLNKALKIYADESEIS